MGGMAPEGQIIPAAAAVARVLRGVFQLPTALTTVLAAMVSKAQLLAQQSFMRAVAVEDGRLA